MSDIELSRYGHLEHQFIENRLIILNLSLGMFSLYLLHLRISFVETLQNGFTLSSAQTDCA